MKTKTLIIITLLSLFNLSVFSQSRSPAVENEIIIKTETGTQTREFLEAANAQGTSMNIFTLLSLFAFIATPFGIYLIIEKQNANKKTQELQKNVVLMSQYQKNKQMRSESVVDDDDDFEDQAA